MQSLPDPPLLSADPNDYVTSFDDAIEFLQIEPKQCTYLLTHGGISGVVKGKDLYLHPKYLEWLRAFLELYVTRAEAVRITGYRHAALSLGMYRGFLPYCELGGIVFLYRPALLALMEQCPAHFLSCGAAGRVLGLRSRQVDHLRKIGILAAQKFLGGAYKYDPAVLSAMFHHPMVVQLRKGKTGK